MFKVGEQWQFDDEQDKVFTVRAESDLYAVLTTENGEWYTIIDLMKKIRGCNNYIFNPYDYSKQEDIENCLQDLEDGTIEVSHKNSVPLGTFKRIS